VLFDVSQVTTLWLDGDMFIIVVVLNTDTVLLQTPKKIVLTSPCWKQELSNWNFSTMSRIVSIHVDYFFSVLIYGLSITALQNEIMFKAPPGEWIYK